MADKIINFLRHTIGTTFWVILIFVFIRILEYTYVFVTQANAVSLDLFFSRSVNFDSLLVLLFSLLLILPLFLLSLINFKLFLATNRTLAFLLIFIDLAFTQYFLTNNALLTSQLFEFSGADIKNIIFNEFTINRLPFWIGVIFVLCLSVYVLFFKKIQLKKRTEVLLLIIYSIGVIATLANLGHLFKDLKYFDSNYSYLLGNSKITYFVKSYYVKKEKDSGFNFFDKTELTNKINDFHKTNDKMLFNENEFPFIHSEAYNNVLGNFFVASKTKPNVVIIISESLSSSFSGKDNIYGSLTPFTDSLMNAGLSWKHFLSNAERSYGALPNILASMPLCVNERGFINTKVEYPGHKKYPSHTTLIELLKQNGYVTNYYYGGWGNFDNASDYLHEKNIDNFICEGDFNTSKYGGNKSNSSGVWGYNDKKLFNQSLDLYSKHINGKPFLSVYQTISNHGPFNLSEESYYSDAYLTKKLASINVPVSILKKIDKKIVSSVFFADDALKLYVYEMQKKPEFANTIFIITGDHASDINIDKGPFKNYRTPLIIYSPLLKKARSFEGVCSHIDILPSLLALLKENFSLDLPEKKHWIGYGLDTSKVFNVSRPIPLNLSSMDIPNFIVSNYFLQGEEVYSFDSTLKTFNAVDASKAEEIKKAIKPFYYLNNYACVKNKIWY